MKISFSVCFEIKTGHAHSKDSERVTRSSWQRLRKLVRRRDDSRCQYCGEFCVDGHVDHVLPISKGGSDTIGNLVWACPPCNNEKGDSIWSTRTSDGGERPAFRIEIVESDGDEPTPYDLPVSEAKLRDVANAVLGDGMFFSRDSLATQARILTQGEYRNLSDAMDRIGLLVTLPNNKRELTAAGRSMLKALLA